MTERETMPALLRLGWTLRRIERETGHRRETIGRYGREAGLLPRKAAKVATDPGESVVAAPATVTEAATNHGFAGAYNAVKRFVGRLRPRWRSSVAASRRCRARGTGGLYGEGAPTRYPRAGKYRRPRLFVMTLSMSRHAFRKTVWNSSKQVWCQLHEEAFAFFGGTLSTLRLDNLREEVITPDIYDEGERLALQSNGFNSHSQTRVTRGIEHRIRSSNVLTVSLGPCLAVPATRPWRRRAGVSDQSSSPW